MGYTRRDFVYAALAEIGYSTDTFDVPPDRLEQCKTRLDTLMAMWNAKGIKIGYPLPDGPDSDIDAETAVPDSAFEAIITNVALRIAPLFGKSVSPETRANAKAAFNTLMALHAMPLERSLKGLPIGSGNKPWLWGPLTFIPPDNATKAPDDVGCY